MTKILVAEDERDIRDLIRFSLLMAGFEVVMASNGMEAVELARGEKPDLILMDLRMPKMTGYQALEVLKKNPETADIPIVFLSAMSDKDRFSQIEGVEDFILKPFEVESLPRRVREILKRTASKE
jgi:two-component system alkaline phosphatase synthesis response regulator PhoP